MELTVAEVSGLIAAGNFVLQILIPLAIPWALSAFLSQENSVITWTILARFFHSSLWPSILGISSTETAGVPWRIYLTSWGQVGLLFLLSVAAICSPLGLYSSIEPASSATEKQFSYIADRSAFRYGTPLRSEGPFTRFCGTESPCPGTTITQTCATRGLSEVCNDTVYESRIPEDLASVFKDGAAAVGPTVASIFDMQYRMYRNSTDQNSELGWYTKPDYRTMSVQILEDKIKLVEGLITDLQDGGIGFRNHTAPKATLKYGASWTEDILFIEPETECVPLNLSIHAITPPSNFNGRFLENFSLVDDGGFADLSRTAPPGSTATAIEQGELDLKDRAYRAAWLNNHYTMVFLNITDGDSQTQTRVDSVHGQRIDLGDGKNNNFSITFSAIQTNLNYGAYLNFTATQNRTFNPHNVTALDFRTASTICGGTTNSSPSNVNSTLVACGLVLGAATRTDGGDNRILDPGTPWTIPLYSCATAIKALVKTVEFQYNGTGFDALKVSSFKPKEYKTPASLPTWGVEDLPEHDIDTAPPMWGLLSPNPNVTALTHYNITTISAASIHLPGYMTPEYPLLRGLNSVPLGSGQNLPGVDFYNQALMTAYTVGAQGFENPEADYSGGHSLALYAKWQGLSKTVDGAAKIIDLVWTDVATNAVVGTAGWGLTASPSSAADGDQSSKSESKNVNVPVFVYGSHIRYRIPWAIPAFVTLGITAMLLALLMTMLVTRRTGFERLRSILESTTLGRVLAPLIPAPDHGHGLGEGADVEITGPGDWVRMVGRRKVLITPEVVSVNGTVLEDKMESIQMSAGQKQQFQPGPVADVDADANADVISPLYPDKVYDS
ncbi:predicted protein [Aspergillus nidulans FGSC A4]|uniref:Uncharacterized protein n=1 Tax=Emericella nidulans (strain FGSC A4 / ATCC 38163 / CBS 112.46 / NRRL 194 / M139) TaxID=227321 RepID=Q5B2B5_EMENI|nr:hypothetical protein [Aspergillus nidulans FGSC A4]EAA62475.1 predicted protein [Aspergillus nidulans FGSC A4]CBF82114.1 TPA: conserved hypothetical protein [Aspergillus nidulans FGSC A4]|eukprot:XP_662919.1 predicted protein [Aspergillus nidulans FGSC A4]